MNKPVKRCRTLCGEDAAGCFITNAGHLDCITDIVINKVWPVREIIKIAAGENPGAETSGMLNRATGELDELIAWVKELQALKKRRLDEENEEAICRR
jgi:hypothetical protein